MSISSRPIRLYRERRSTRIGAEEGGPLAALGGTTDRLAMDEQRIDRAADVLETGVEVLRLAGD
jgi:hypothetical protein